MSHGHGHQHHHHEPAQYGKVFAAGIGLNVLFVAVEAIYGFFSDSLSLLADAGHNLSDVLGLIISWAAVWLGKKLPTKKRTYGFKKSSVIAALLNAIILLIAIGAIFVEAVQRFAHPEPVAGKTVMAVAVIGIIINTITALLFMSGRKTDLNIRGAFLHMAADALVSLGVVIAGAIMLFTGWEWVDPVTSILIAVVIFAGTWGLLRESADLSLDAVPAGVDAGAIKTYLEQIPTVLNVHDLHIWGMSTTETILTVHIVRSQIEDNDQLLEKLEKDLHDKFGIEHATIQIEKGTYACGLAPDNKV
ncbi:cation diffusion facilitator family transporter [Heyndrickxia coagulans]|uniref:cation diffusion facilitator family transporter n=1 Tax=Heyndrickxia coagulans TaxID=1398 RepID=UPI000E53C4A0|nr:cation diffusion facilitator family transporter [Heyndrickxia coagulans]MED4934446.1 cation diffusion facilitator family transporter [Heyndrickxia coagulans]MED4968135.1 cation diffusion facilitator family transporter [Heyndrickxia coagulans]RGR85705.1 cation transporter [Heyndrickxia coagulans]RGR98943.1 cation transporter [Heyndrickxia coagulans]